MTIAEIKNFIKGGEWVSIAPEIRPSISKNADGSMKPFYLTRVFKYLPVDKFGLSIISYADAYGKVPLVKMNLRGSMVWGEEHPIAVGAYKVDFHADEAYEVTPMHQGFADIINNLPNTGLNKWEVGVMQDIKGKAFPAFGLAEGQIFSECDLMYIFNDMMFWGARNVDGRGFDKPENRPTNLQIPLVRRRQERHKSYVKGDFAVRGVTFKAFTKAKKKPVAGKKT